MVFEKLFFLPWDDFISERWEGRINLLSISEKIRQKTTTQPIAAFIDDVRPVTNKSGANAMIVVRTPNVAGTATRLAPATMLSNV